MTTEIASLAGTGVGTSAAIGPIVHACPVPAVPSDEPQPCHEDALKQIRTALESVRLALHTQAAATAGTAGETLEAASAIAEDPALFDAILAELAQGVGPATAVDRASERFGQLLRDSGPYLAQRVTDLLSVRHRVIAALLGMPAPGIPELTTPSVIVAEDLSPADTATAPPELLAALVTEQGGPTSHTAIIAGQLGIPCLVGVRGATSLPPGRPALVDASQGSIHLDPPQEQVATVQQRQRQLSSLLTDTAAGGTSDGHPVELLANITAGDDASQAARSGAEGVGLLRTEFLFMGRSTPPGVSEQVSQYAQVFDAFSNQKVVIRTLDAGSDKPLAFVTDMEEPNPALGIRGYRTARSSPRVLTDQLTALARAGRDHGLGAWVMAPMISTPCEAASFARFAREAGISTVGAMIEVPGAALLAKEIVEHLDFVSIGTNDLAQYTMGADRLSSALADLTDRWQPATLRLVQLTAQAANSVGKPVGVCGESASDPLMALVLTGLGITSLSMAPPAIPAVRYAIRSHSLRQCQAIAHEAVDSPTAREARESARRHVEPEVLQLLRL